jgi:uncharacterized protein YecE (DUF72 family)
LALLPKETRSTFEFRHESWFDDEVFEILKRFNVALCIAENEEFKVPPISTGNFGYLRLRREDYTTTDLRKWADWIAEQPFIEMFIYFKHEQLAVGPKFAAEFLAILAQN